MGPYIYQATNPKFIMLLRSNQHPFLQFLFIFTRAFHQTWEISYDISLTLGNRKRINIRWAKSTSRRKIVVGQFLKKVDAWEIEGLQSVEAYSSMNWHLLGSI